MSDPNLLIRTLLILHVLAGVTALFGGPVAMLTKKGGKAHRLAGKTYFWAMLVIFVTAIGVLFYRVNVFLLVISIFSFYNALTGYRVLFRKRPERQPAAPLDWFAAVVMLLSGAGFMLWGIGVLTGMTTIGVPAHASIRGLPAAFPYLALVFGAFSVQMSAHDIRLFRTPDTTRNAWWFYHMLRMLGGYIATVTAFMAQQVSPHLPPQWSWTVWVLPVLVGLPGAYYWVGVYRRKFARGHTARPAAMRGVPPPPNEFGV